MNDKDAQGYPKGSRYFHVIGRNPYSADVVLPNGIVCYTKQTFAEYQTANSDEEYSIPVEWDQYNMLIQAWENEKMSQPAKMISSEEWFDKLECLPPCRWANYGSINAFHVSERLFGDFVSWYARGNGVHVTFDAPATATWEFIIAKFGEALIMGVAENGKG